MEPIVTPGLVLKETRYKESDRIITILTPGLGVISASAQSSLRLKNKLFSACGLFCYSEFVLLPGRNMYTVREAESKNVFHGIASSIEGMSLAMYMAEMAAALSPTGEEAEKELVAEVIREKALLFMRDEIPHGIAVVVERFKERPGTDLVDIDVNIYCERESHKGMVIGKGGAMLKKIASAARADCEEFLGCRVNLQCWVKVKADWRDNEFLLNNFGFKQNPNNR